MYPTTRMRRLRSSLHLRNMVGEYTLRPSNFILPLFVKQALKGKERVPILSMPGVFQHSIESAVEECKQAVALGIPAVILFGIPEKKDTDGTEAYNPQGIISRAVSAIKRELGLSILVACDVCLCQYTSHGQCAPLRKNIILNDQGIEHYARAACVYANAGADIVAPSGMMDGQVACIRQALDEQNFTNTVILSYAVKYASGFYGPFRDAAESGFAKGPKDRKTHQMDPLSAKQALREAELDIAEGADIIMVKPALPYLDIIHTISERYPIPLAAYHVSGEYAMLKAASKQGWLDEQECVKETMLAIRRAGATMIITYFAKQAAQAFA